MDNSKLTEEYGYINSSYLINNLDKKSKKNEKLSKNMSINEFLNSEEYKGLEKKYPYCNLLLYTNSKLKKVIYNMKTKKFYDEDLNEIILTEESKSNYAFGYIDIIFNEEYEPKKLTLSEYINTINKQKELYIFKHEVHIECDENGLSEYVNIIFGERETIVLNDSCDKLEEGKNGEFNKLIIDVNLLIE